MRRVVAGALILLGLTGMRPALAGPGGGPVAQSSDWGSRLITSVVVSSPPEWQPGQVLSVTLTGRPGGQATFDMGPIIGIPLYEGPAGTYRGSYVLTQNDASLVNPVVLGHLHMPDGQSDTGQPGGAGSGPLNVNVNTGGVATLMPGQTFQVTVNGPAGGLGTFDVAGHYGLAMTEVAAGVYLGSYTVQATDPPSAHVVAHVAINGTSLQTAAPMLLAFGTAAAGPQISSITTSAQGPLMPNQTATISVTATPGLVGFVQIIGGQTYPLAEVTPGTYVGNITVPVEVDPGPYPVAVTLRDASGRTVNQPAPFSLVVGGGGAPPSAVPGGQVIIDSPTMRSEVQGGFEVQGRSIPGSSLLVSVFVTQSPVPGGPVGNKQFEARVPVAQDGTFNVPVVLHGAGPGQLLDVRVQSLDPNGSPVGQDEVVVQLR